MKRFYQKTVVDIKVGTVPGNLQDFVSPVQVEKRLSALDIQKVNARCAIELIEAEEKVLRAFLEKK